jgi:hypothetical protein
VCTTGTGCHPGVRGMAPLQGTTGKPSNINTCCEAQGSRMFGSLPEYIFTTVEAVGLGLGRTIALYYRSSPSHHIR